VQLLERFAPEEQEKKEMKKEAPYVLCLGEGRKRRGRKTCSCDRDKKERDEEGASPGRAGGTIESGRRIKENNRGGGGEEFRKTGLGEDEIQINLGKRLGWKWGRGKIKENANPD